MTKHIGETYNYWTVIGVGSTPRHWLLRCRCGSVVERQSSHVVAGRSRSCGCRPNRGNTQHGAYRTAEHRTWRHMIERCTSPTGCDWPDYGGRGITVCERWLEFANFLADMGPRPKGTSLDRIDVDGNYEPSNCRWATATVQARNTRRALMVEIDGETKPLKEWCELRGIAYSYAYARLYRQKLPPELALSRP